VATRIFAGNVLISVSSHPHYISPISTSPPQ
jgi:hypothetical protein